MEPESISALLARIDWEHVQCEGCPPEYAHCAWCDDCFRDLSWPCQSDIVRLAAHARSLEAVVRASRVHECAESDDPRCDLAEALAALGEAQ